MKMALYTLLLLCTCTFLSDLSFQRGVFLVTLYTCVQENTSLGMVIKQLFSIVKF